MFQCPCRAGPWCLRLLASEAEGHERCSQSSTTNSSLTLNTLCRQEGRQSPEFALKCQKNSRSQTTTHKSKCRDAAGMWACRNAGTGVPSSPPQLKALSLFFVAGIKDSQIKPFLPCAVRCLDVLSTLLQSAQNAALPLNCCFSREGCSAGKCLGWQTLRRSSSPSLSG